MRVWPAVIVVLLLAAPAAHAKKFRYASGPKPAADHQIAHHRRDEHGLARAGQPRDAEAYGRRQCISEACASRSERGSARQFEGGAAQGERLQFPYVGPHLTGCKVAAPAKPTAGPHSAERHVMEDDENSGPDDDEAHQQDRTRTKKLAHHTHLRKPG